MEEIVLNVNGMMCQGCENRIKNSLKVIKGIDDVVADYKTGKVTLFTKENIDITKIKEKIEDIGFEVK